MLDRILLKTVFHRIIKTTYDKFRSFYDLRKCHECFLRLVSIFMKIANIKYILKIATNFLHYTITIHFLKIGDH